MRIQSAESKSMRIRRGASEHQILFTLTTLGLAGLAFAAVCWAASSMLAQNGSERLLRVTHLFPKLKSGERKADAFRMSEPVPSATAQPKERATLTPAQFPPVLDYPKVTTIDAAGPVPTPEPPRFPAGEPLMIAKLEGTQFAEPCLDPVVYLEPCAPKRGDTPMIRNWKMLTMVSLLSAATVAPPVVAGEKQDVNTNLLQKSIDALIKRIDALEKKPIVDDEAIIRALKAEIKKLENGALADIGADISAVQSEQRRLKKDVDDQKVLINLLSGRINDLERKLAGGSGAPTPAVDKAFMDDLRTMMKTLTDIVAKSGPTQAHVAMAPPTPNGATGGARVLLSNHYPDELLFVVNGVGHRLPARSSKVVDVNAGAVNYEVFSSRFGYLEKSTRNLASGYTFNLSAQ